MSLSNPLIHQVNLPHVEIFTYGESTIYGYDDFNKSLIKIEINELNGELIEHLSLSIQSTENIREMKLNPDETILALLSNEIIYFVYLPQISQSSSSQINRLCPVNKLLLNEFNELIDLIWLSSNHLIIVNSIPSSSECHLYSIKPRENNSIVFIQTYSTDLLKSKRKTNRKYSPDHLSNIVQLDFIEINDHLLLFALKSNGNIFLMKIDQNQLMNNEKNLSCSFVGPISVTPSTHDNYGGDYSHSKMKCICLCDMIILVFTDGKNRLNECILLNPVLNEFYLFVIHSICFSNNNLIRTIHIDQLNENIFYLIDSLNNIYSIQINSINKIQQKSRHIDQTTIQHLFKINSSILHSDFIQTKYIGQYLSFITQKTNNQHEKELIYVRPNSIKTDSIYLINDLIKPNVLNSSSEFVKRIQTILQRDQSFEQFIRSTSNQQFIIQFLTQQYLDKQDKVRYELQNKQRYLNDFQQTQNIAQQELNEKFEEIYQKFSILHDKYQHEYLRQKELLQNVDDLLSRIEQQKPIESNAQIFMQRQLNQYHIQIINLKEKFNCLQQFLSLKENFNGNQRQIDRISIEKFQQFIGYYQKQIESMKQQLENISHNNINN